MKRSKRYNKSYQIAKKEVTKYIANEYGEKYLLKWDNDYIEFLIRRKMVENYKSQNQKKEN